MTHTDGPHTSTTSEAEAEKERLMVLQATRLVDTAQSEDFDRLTRLAAQLFGMPTALVSFVTEDRQWFKSRVGMDCHETERDAAFCAHTIQRTSVMVVEDARLDPRFQSNRLVTGQPGIRFYAGAPLVTRSGHALGSLCVIDYAPRSFSPEQRQQLADMAQIVMSQVDLHQAAGRLHEVTRLPNRSQLVIDLHDLALVGAAGPRTMVLVDIMSHAQVQSAIVGLGIESVEKSLRIVARRIGEVVGESSTLYHVGDTRFIFLLRGDDAAAHESAAADMLAHMRSPLRVGNVSIELEIQCGMVRYEPSTAHLDDLMRKATSAMRHAQLQQSSFKWYDEAFDAPHRRAFRLVQAIPQGLTSGQFRLVYQPKLDVVKGRFTGVEALLRWNHPRFGSVSPAEFIPAVEKTMAINLITEWVLHTALAQMARWQKLGLYITMAVNVSARNLDHPHFLQIVKNACATHEVAPRYLHLECTENAVLTGLTTREVLHELRAMGIQISLDDFGIGYSNLACLQDLPAELLKLDQSLVKPIAEDFRAWNMLQSLVAMGHMLGYRVLAEGVETASIYEQLLHAGCDAMQGYFLSRPLEADAVLEFMRDSAKTTAVLRNPQQ